MMIHEKLMSGQFLLDLKNDHAANLLHAHSHASHHSLHALHPHLHHHHHQQQHQQQQQLPSPPMPAAVKMDLYSAYAYQQHLQQQLAGSASITDVPLMNVRSPPQQRHQPVEVLDLSRRCDSMDSPPPKTPSPYQSMTSSFGTGSPAHSPTNSQPAQQQQLQQQARMPSNLLYASQDASSAAAALTLPGSLAALYPGLYYPGAMAATQIKPDPAAMSSITAITPPLTQSAVPQTRQTSPVDATPRATATATTNTLLQTFASAAAVAAAASVTAINGKVESSDGAPLSPVSGNIATASNAKPPTTMATTPTSSTSASAALATLDSKTTRPFKAFPRDPLVIAANFAATDVLLDNPRVERYTEYRKRVLEQIRSSNGGSRTVTNPKMRRTNSRSGSINDGCSSSNNNSENDERSVAADESSDCDSNAGNFEKLTNSNGNNASTTNSNSNNNNNSNNTSSSSETNACNSTSSAASTANNAIHSTSSMGVMVGGSQVKDAAYFERRRKNNAAAKKSRDRRRIKEDEIAIRAAYLERQNIELLCQIDALKAQLAAFTSKVGA